MRNAKLLFFLSALPLLCLNGCFCYFSVDDDANTMNCSHKSMVHLPHRITPQTEQLIMSENDIRLLDMKETNLTQIKLFHFENNNIESVSSKTLQFLLSNAVVLNLKGNKLQKLPKLFNQPHTKTKLWLSGNPYVCNCNMMWMKDWLQNNTNVMDTENITCSGGKWDG